MKNVFFYNTIIGEIGIAENGTEITNIFFKRANMPIKALIKETEILSKASNQLNDYLAGKRVNFDLPTSYASGTEFQKSVWKALASIPYGETRSYKDIAIQIGKPNACRAVGMANNKNPLIIIVPCHRVIGANGKLVGYAGGIDIKEKLIGLEKTHN